MTLWHGYIGSKGAIPKVTHQINDPIITAGNIVIVTRLT